MAAESRKARLHVEAVGIATERCDPETPGATKPRNRPRAARITRYVAIGIVRSVAGQMTKALAADLLAFRAQEDSRR